MNSTPVTSTTETDVNPPSTPDAARRRGALGAKVFLILLLAGLLKLSFNKVDPDLWGHVQYGRDVLATGELAQTATYTYSFPSHPWINHENLAELVFAALGGPVPLMIFKCLLASVVIVLMLRAAERQQAGFLCTGVIVLLAVMNMAPGWAMRPQIFTYTFFALMVVLLDRYFDRDASTLASRSSDVFSKLWWAPLLMLVWTNTHGGFVAGYCIFVLYLLCRSAEALRHHGRSAWPQIRGYALVVAASGLATLVNPYGPRLQLWLLASLGQPRPEIAEWAPLRPSEDAFIPAVLLMGLTVLAWSFGGRKRSFTQTVLLAITAWQTVSHVRHVPFFATLVGLWVAPHLKGLLGRIQQGQKAQDEDLDQSPKWGRWLNRAMWATAAALAVALMTQVREMRVDKSVYPVEAFQYMADHNLKGRMVVFFDWAQYAIAAFGSDSTVGFDGRFRTCYPQRMVDMHFDLVLGDLPDHRSRSVASGIVDGTRVLQFGNPDLVLISRKLPHAPKVMREQRNHWVLLYQDSLAQLWGRKAKYDNHASPHYIAENQRRITDKLQVGHARWPALPRRPEA